MREMNDFSAVVCISRYYGKAMKTLLTQNVRNLICQQYNSHILLMLFTIDNVLEMPISITFHFSVQTVHGNTGGTSHLPCYQIGVLVKSLVS